MRLMMRWGSVLLLILPMLTHAQSIRLTSGEYPPFISQHLPNQGPLTEIIVLAAEEANLDITFGYFLWHESMALAQQGQWNGTVGWAFTKERALDFIYSDAIYTESAVFFHRKDKAFNWSKPEDLAGLAVGVGLGYIDVNTLTRLQKSGIDVKLQEFETEEDQVHALLNNQIDIALGNKDVLLYIIKTTLSAEQARQLTYHPHPFRVTPLHVLFSRKIKQAYEHSRAFNKGLRRIKTDSRYKAVWNQFRRQKLPE
ncbi:substrate-binding periplasmic protein [Salinivibrio kushneri]|uniref:substrate-binding periplasmic protein n=1 Tax=Salinivibrio kushneri TaxID=1908198 RepID=UPI000C829C09|nr:transporter substrate-binding domain-containing protein [Salinivibrio kushneri]